jgi:ribosomal protein L11 methyltransferase
LAPAMAAHLAPCGIAILSGLLVEQADDIVAVYKTQGVTLVEREDLGEWTALTLSSA